PRSDTKEGGASSPCGPTIPFLCFTISAAWVTTPGRTVGPYRDRKSVRPCLRHDHLSFSGGTSSGRSRARTPPADWTLRSGARAGALRCGQHLGGRGGRARTGAGARLDRGHAPFLFSDGGGGGSAQPLYAARRRLVRLGPSRLRRPRWLSHRLESLV